VRTASRQRGRQAPATVDSAVSGSTTGVTSAGASPPRPGRRCPERDCGSAPVAGSVLTPVGFSTRAERLGGAIVRLRTTGNACTVGTFLAVSATVCTGRRKNSDTSATTTGVAAALTSVPAPQIRDAANDAAADATLAMISVCTEIRPPDRVSLRPALGSRDSTTSA